MDILTEDMKKDLKEKFKALDINDEHFQEKAQEIIDEAIVGNKDKIGETVVQKTVDEALEDEQEGFRELHELMKEGVLEDIEDEELRDKLEEQATFGIIDEATEKVSLETAGFLKEPNRETTIEDVVEEILKQLEEVIEEKKQEIEEKIQKNEDMFGKVQKREQLRASKVRVNNLHQKTKNYKGTEGKKLNQNVEAAITDLDKQINALVAATTIDGNELQSEELKQEREQLVEEKKKLEDMSKFLKEKYTKDHAKEASKTILKDEIEQIMSEMSSYRKTPNKLVKKCEELNELRKKNEKNFSADEIKAIFRVPLGFDIDSDKKITAFTLAGVGQLNSLRRLYLNTSNKTEKTDKDMQVLEDCRKVYGQAKEAVEDICYGKGPLPLKTEEEYVVELNELGADAKETGFIKGRKARDVASKARTLRLVLNEIISVTKTRGIQEAYARLRETLGKNKSVKTEELPKELSEPAKKEKVPVVERVKTPIHKSDGNEDRETEKSEEKGKNGHKGTGDEEEGDEEPDYIDL